jgi:hypothetical protein
MIVNGKRQQTVGLTKKKNAGVGDANMIDNWFPLLVAGTFGAFGLYMGVNYWVFRMGWDKQ